MSTISAQRQALQAEIFPDGIPRLWCPTLTHFQAARTPDPERIQAHLAALAPCVKGILVPGSTGEGWEMTDSDIRGLLDIVLAAAAEQGIRVLIGVLKTSTDEVLARGWPTALYQLPQVTQNELAPETVAALAAEFANILTFVVN